MRVPTVDDRDAVVALLSANDGIARWTTIPFPYSAADFQNWLAMAGQHYLILNESDSIIGAVGVVIDQSTCDAEIGYWLAETGRGKGAATAAVRTLAEAALSAGAERIWAEVIAGNDASSRVLERAGFSRDGLLRSMHRPRCGLDGNRMDVEVWSRLPTD